MHALEPDPARLEQLPRARQAGLRGHGPAQRARTAGGVVRGTREVDRAPPLTRSTRSTHHAAVTTRRSSRPGDRSTRILIADDEPLARNRLASLCAGQRDLDVGAQAEAGRA